MTAGLILRLSTSKWSIHNKGKIQINKSWFGGVQRMNTSTGDSMNKSVEKLIDKMERMYERQAIENNRVDNMMSSLDRLAEIVARLESGKNLEAEFNKKIDLLNESLERVVNIQQNLAREQEGTHKTFNKFVEGTKVFGQILSVVAASIQMAVDNIGSVLKKNNEECSFSPDKTQVVKTQADLSVLLQPLSTLVKNLVEEKIKQHGTVNTISQNIDPVIKDTENTVAVGKSGNVPEQNS
jgi:hypothetical protein